MLSLFVSINTGAVDGSVCAYDAFHWIEWTEGTAFVKTMAKPENNASVRYIAEIMATGSELMSR